MIQGYQLDHSLSLPLLKHFFDNVLLEQSGQPNVLSLADFGLGQELVNNNIA